MKHTNDIIAAQHFEGELYIKASDHHRIVRDKVAAEREACAKYFDGHWRETWTDEQIAEAIRARGQE
jgi:hypothetical protein